MQVVSDKKGYNALCTLKVMNVSWNLSHHITY